VSISLEAAPVAPDMPRKPLPLPRARVIEMANVTQAAADETPGDAIDLWVDQSGRLLFNSADKFRAYRRCLAAHNGHAVPECPAPTASDAGTSVVMRRRVSRGWH